MAFTGSPKPIFFPLKNERISAYHRLGHLMDGKIKEAFLKQVKKEPFAKKFGLKLVDMDEGYSRVEMNITHLSPPSPGRRLIAEAREVHQTQKTSLCEIKVFDEQDHQIASCQALAYRKGIPHPFLQKEKK